MMRNFYLTAMAALAALPLPSCAWLPQGASSSGPSYYFAAVGNDSNPGTQAQPWKTINAIYSHYPFSAGARFLFNGGETFTGQLYLDPTYMPNSSAINPITIASYGSGKATFFSTKNGIFLYNLQGVDIRNVNIVSGGAGVNSGTGILFGHDLPNTTLNHIVVDSVNVSGFSGTFSGGNYIPNGAGIGIFLYSGSATSLWQNISITNTVTHDNSLAGLIFVGNGTTKTISNVYLGYLTAYNHLGVTGVTNSNGSGIIVSGTVRGTIENCVAYNNGQNNTNISGPYGIWAYQADQITMQFNESYSNRTQGVHDGGGFDFDGGTTNSIMQYNYAHDNDGPGFLVNQYTGGDNTVNNTVRYNISENDAKVHEGGIMIHADTVANLTGTNIYNNTIYNGGGAASASGIFAFGGSTNTTLRDNIIITTGGKALLAIADTHTGLSIQGNDYWPSGGSFLISYGGSSKTSLAQFRIDTGQERNPLSSGSSTGYNVDPLLTSPGSGGTISPASLATLTAYQLQAGSPLVDAGLNLSSLFSINPGTRDFYRNTIPQGGGYSVGAHDR